MQTLGLDPIKDITTLMFFWGGRIQTEKGWYGGKINDFDHSLTVNKNNY